MSNSNHVMTLRQKTGAGVLDCKNALQEAQGDLDKAVEILRKKGLADAAKRMGRAAKEGVIYSYVHTGGRIGALIEINCETDFVARTEEFQGLGKELALQIVGAAPRWLSREEVPAEVLEKEKEIYRQQAQNEGRPAQALEKVVEGRLNKFYQQFCLMEQPSVRDSKTTVSSLVQQLAAKCGENVTVRRFVRFQLGE